jgi:coenzyme F420-reducing hydrogenase beta subunit
MNLDQQVQLTKEEDLRDLLMIGGIQVFLPLAQEEAEICVADAATTEEQSVVTIRERRLEQIFEAAQEEEEKENEHSEEWLNIFSQELKRLQHGSLQQKKKKQTTFVLLICGNK